MYVIWVVAYHVVHTKAIWAFQHDFFVNVCTLCHHGILYYTYITPSLPSSLSALRRWRMYLCSSPSNHTHLFSWKQRLLYEKNKQTNHKILQSVGHQEFWRTGTYYTLALLHHSIYVMSHMCALFSPNKWNVGWIGWRRNNVKVSAKLLNLEDGQRIVYLQKEDLVYVCCEAKPPNIYRPQDERGKNTIHWIVFA